MYLRQAPRSIPTQHLIGRATEPLSPAGAAYITFAIVGAAFLGVALWLTIMIVRALAEEKRRNKRKEMRAEESKEKPQLHSDCIPHPGPHEMEAKQLPYEAENTGSEKVELPAILPAELLGDVKYEPVEVDVGSVDTPSSSDVTVVND